MLFWPKKGEEMKNVKIMSLLSLMLMVSLQANIEDVMNREWVEETTPNHTYSVKEEIKKHHGKTIEPSVDIKYVKNKLNSGINRIVTIVEPMGHEVKTVTKTWTDKNGSYLTFENAVFGTAALAAVGVGVAGAYAYNEYNKLNNDFDKLGQDLKVASDDLMNYENNRQLDRAEQKGIDVGMSGMKLGMDAMQVNPFWYSKATVDNLKARLGDLASDIHEYTSIKSSVANDPNFDKQRFAEFKANLNLKDKEQSERLRAEFARKNQEREDKIRAEFAAKNNSEKLLN